jgi:pimeloyl-ACP methyl ester carboxylesterase
MRWGRVSGVLLASVMLAGFPGGASAAPVASLPVAFEVVNTNTSDVPCPSDGESYVTRGRLVGPPTALRGPTPRAVTLWLHGFNAGGFMWGPPDAPELDLAAALARLGHASLVVDRLGYDASDHPHGSETCLGSQADVTQQIVRRLRTGEYEARGGPAPSFQTVVLAGHDAGAVIADIAAYSYDDLEGLIHLTWADQGFSDDTRDGYAKVVQTCATGGQPAEQGPPRDDPPGGPSGYSSFLTDEKIRAEQINTEPAHVERLMRLWNRNPCGEFVQAPVAAQINARRLADVRVPVLYGYGEHEFIWTQDGLAQQEQHFSGSRDVTTAVWPRTGHFPMLSREAGAFHATVAEWLRSRELLGAGALTAHGCPAANRTLAGPLVGGTDGPDNVVGESGADRLSGAGGDDCLVGGRGDDQLWSGAGGDLVRCGPGRDRASVDRSDVVRGCEAVRVRRTTRRGSR